MAIGTGTAILGAAAIGAVGSSMAAKSQASAARDAAGLQAQATRESVAEQRRQYNQTRKDFAPWREVGRTALTELGALYGVGEKGMVAPEVQQAAYDRFREAPGYQFAFDEGIRALDRSASAGGRLMGGGYGRELVRYGQGIADQQFNTYADRLAALAGTGQSSTAATANAGANAAANIGSMTMAGAAAQGNAMMAAGTARASGYAGIANAANSGVNNYLFMQALGKMAA